MNSTPTIIIGDSRKMSELKGESVHLVVPSPPYWQLKDYGNGGQIGFNDSYEDYINNLNFVWKECYRVLHKGCRLCVNIGDQFARSVYYGRYKIINQEKFKINFKEEIKKLPYVFKDPVKFDKKFDPKKLQFGSKLDNSDNHRELYHSVKEIISPEMIILDNNLKVRLIGVKENKKINGRALQFLREKLKGQKVFLKFDTAKYDSNGHLQCYLYLKNKTFINAHLIKAGLVAVDTRSEFKYKPKFIAITQRGAHEN